MRQLTIVFADDIEDRVIQALDAAGVEGFVRLSDATGNRFTDPGTVPRTLTWAATIFFVPGVPNDKADDLVRTLEAYAASCTTDPCLRVIVSEVEAVV